MAHIDVVDAIEAHVRATFTQAPIYVENGQTATPDDATPFLSIGFPWSRSERMTVDEVNGEYSEEGAFTITLSIPRGAGLRDGRLVLDALAKTFRGQDIGLVRCSAPQSPTVDDGDGSEPYVGLIMAVPYTFYQEA